MLQKKKTAGKYDQIKNVIIQNHNLPRFLMATFVTPLKDKLNLG